MCGEVRWTATAAPSHSSVCHCRWCRKAAGAQSVAWLTFPRGSFSFVVGKPAEYRSSPPVIRTFCPRCGTSLTYTHDDRPGEIDVTTGSADDPAAYPPKEQVHEEDRLPWV